MTPLVVKERCLGAVAGRAAEAMEMEEEEEVDSDRCIIDGGGSNRWKKKKKLIATDV